MNTLAGRAQYLAEKNYLLSFVKSWQLENEKFGISSFAIYPKAIETNINRNINTNYFISSSQNTFEEINQDFIKIINL